MGTLRVRLFGTELPLPLEPAVRACGEHLRFAAGLSALVNILYLSPTLYMMQIYDRAVPTGGLVTLIWLTIVVAFALATLTMLDALRSRVLVRAGMRLDNQLSAIILDHTIGLRLKFGDSRPQQQAMREFDNLRQAMSGAPMIALFDIAWVPIYLVVSFMVHPAIGALALAASLVLLAITWANERENRAGAKLAIQTLATAYGNQERLAQQGELIRTLGMRRAVVARQLAERRNGLTMFVAQQLSSGRYAALAKFVRLFLQSLALGLGAWLAIEQQISIGSIIAASILLTRSLQPIEMFVGSWASLSQARQAIDSLAVLLADGDDQREKRFDLPPPRARILAAGVTVNSPAGDGTALLDNVSFEIGEGEFVGVIGPSGAGKSLVARVLSGAVAPDSGKVRIDGSDIHDWDAERLAEHIGYLPQDASLLPGTIADNISRFATNRGGDTAGVADAVLAAAALAGVHELIVNLPGGYHRRVGWNGEGLSAGQRQRVALARALFGNPRLLVLDEPNSALDSDGETALLHAIGRLRAEGATVIMVTHRPALLTDATRLLVLMNGAVKHYGPRQEVIDLLDHRRLRPVLSDAKAV